MKKAQTTLLLAGTLLVAGPMQQAHATAFEKAKFVFHLGVAYYAFNTWVWKPYRNYQFKVGAPGQKAAITKAGLALAFAAYQVNSAYNMVRTSNDPFLHNLGTLLPNFSKSLTNVANNMKNGRFDEQGIQNLNRTTQNLLNSAENQGHPIRPVAVPIPGL